MSDLHEARDPKRELRNLLDLDTDVGLDQHLLGRVHTSD